MRKENIYPDPHTHPRTQTPKHTNIHVHKHPRTQTPTHTNTHAHKPPHTYTQTLTHTRTHIKNICIYTYMHIYTVYNYFIPEVHNAHAKGNDSPTDMWEDYCNQKASSVYEGVCAKVFYFLRECFFFKS